MNVIGNRKRSERALTAQQGPGNGGAGYALFPGGEPAAGKGFPVPRSWAWPREEVLALVALVFLLLVTVAWWALALWPVPADAPAWLQTARAVCFGAHEDGLPNAGGWILLVGEPLGMLAALLIVWRDATLGAVRRLVRGTGGRLVAALAVLALGAGLGAAALRVHSARAAIPIATPADAPPVRLDRPAPALALVDQRGEILSLASLRGRPVLVAFAFAHCETVCPLLVRDALEVQRRRGDAAPAVVVVTLDPWRDVPSRLPHLARAWGMGPDTYLLSGSVPEVEHTLDGWDVPRGRDTRTGEVIHPPLVYVVDADGRLAYATDGTTRQLEEALSRL